MVRAFLPDVLDTLVRMAQWMATSSSPSLGYLTQRVSLSMSLLPRRRRLVLPRDIERSLPRAVDLAPHLTATLEATHPAPDSTQYGVPTTSCDSAQKNPDCREQTPSHPHSGAATYS
jgi:hypothetical protein